jgi:hypothetical protein
MKKAALLIAFALALPAWGQDAKPPAKEEAKPAAPAAAQPEPKVEEKKQRVARKHTSRRQEDARHCLDKSSNTEIIKCAEEYL